MPNMDFSTFPEFSVARQSKVGRLLHYLYDFLFGGKKGTNHYAVTMSVFSHKMAILDIYTPGIYAAGYIVFALTFVRSSVRMFVR